MKIVLILFAFFLGFCPAILVGQNLLPNANFEDTVPTNPSFVYMPVGWVSPTTEGFNYMTPYNNATPQHLLFSSPSNLVGYQVAKSGVGYIGILVYHLYDTVYRSGVREYLQAQLNSPLIADTTYCFQVYLSLPDSIHFGSRNQLGAYFSNTAVSAPINTRLPYTPQLIVTPNNYVTDKQNWVQYNASYKALGGEQYITIGNFNDTNSIDTITLGGGPKFYHRASYYYLDDVYLGSCDSVPDLATAIEEQDQKAKLKLYPNPSQGVFQIDLPSSNKEVYIFQLYDLNGRLVYSETITKSKQFDLSELPNGMYLVRIQDEMGKVSSEKVIKR